jgi:hypothetical protein
MPNQGYVYFGLFGTFDPDVSDLTLNGRTVGPSCLWWNFTQPFRLGRTTQVVIATIYPDRGLKLLEAAEKVFRF